MLTQDLCCCARQCNTHGPAGEPRHSLGAWGLGEGSEADKALRSQNADTAVDSSRTVSLERSSFLL